MFRVKPSLGTEMTEQGLTVTFKEQKTPPLRVLTTPRLRTLAWRDVPGLSYHRCEK